MKIFVKNISLFVLMILLLSSCSLFLSKDEPPEVPEGENMGYDHYAIDMIEDFPITDSLPPSDGEKIRVILLIGQSNATGCSLTSYLEDGVGE